MENLNSLLQDNVSVDKLFHLHDVTDLESELFDAILTSPTIFSFKDFCKSHIMRKYDQKQIFEALQSLINKKLLSYDSQFRIIKLHLQSIFPHINSKTSDYWIS
jgi:hypothetical protein